VCVWIVLHTEEVREDETDSREKSAPD